MTSSSNFYQLGASLPVDAKSYVRRLADEEFYQKLRSGKFCYVLNSRQMGKSSLRVQTMQRLQSEGTVCAALDLTGIGKHKVTLSQWYGGIVYGLVESCQLEDNFDFDWQTWWQNKQSILDPVTCLRLFIEEVLLEKIQQPIVIFVDEIDRVLSQDFSLDDFFALIRFFQNQRVDNPIFERLTFALLGVATPSDLITDKTQTPFNIGEGIELHGFSIEEAKPLIKGLEGNVSNPQLVMKEILDWTGGQPFLTQKLCQFMVEESFKDNPRNVKEVVESRIIENWESQDDPEHLRTIRDRILSHGQRASYLLELYQRLREKGEIASNNSVEFSELQLSGLVVKIQEKLRVYNRIYQQIFDESWIETQLKNLRPYAENFRVWVDSGGSDESRLLRGKALQEAEDWAKDKSLGYQDKQYLAASQEKEIQEKIAAQKQEAELELERKDKEAVKKRNKLLADANRKAQWRIRVGTVILILTLLIVVILGIKTNESQEYVQTVEHLAKLAEEIEYEGSYDTAKELFSQAAQSINISEHQERLALLDLGISFAYQKLKNKNWIKANNYILDSKKYIDRKRFSSMEDVQLRILLLRTQGNWFKEHNKKNEAITFYKQAFDLINNYRISPFDKKSYLKILSKENVEAIHRDLINLILPIDENNLKLIRESLKNHYFRELENLLRNNKWQEANNQTRKNMLLISKRETEGWFDIESLNNFNCKELRKIDQYWKKYSGDYFGFSVQKNIYNNLSKNVDDFGERVGWYDKKRDWINHQYSDLPPNSPTFEKYAKKGHLPFLEDGKNWVGPYLNSNRCSTIYQVAKDKFVTECKVNPKIRINILYTHVEKCNL